MGKPKKNASPNEQDEVSEVSWLVWAVDILAFDYGWTKDYILDSIYFDELYDFIKLKKKRDKANYRMLLAIAHNPYNSENPGELWDVLSDEKVLGKDDELDKKAFENFKQTLTQSKGFVVK